MESDSSSGWQGKGGLEELMRERIRTTIEGIIDEELVAALGAARSQRSGPVRVGYRHGKRSRTLTTSLGPTTIAMPRARLEGEDGRRREWRSAIIPRYQRRTERVDEAILGNVVQAGLGQNPARQAALKGGCAPRVAAMTINKVCGSGLKAVALAAQKPVGRIVLESPFTSIADIAAQIYWFFPVRLLIKDSFRSDLLIGTVTAPFLILHGDKDSIVPIALGDELYKLITAPKRFVRFPGAGHNELAAYGALEAAKQFLSEPVQP